MTMEQAGNAMLIEEFRDQRTQALDAAAQKGAQARLAMAELDGCKKLMEELSEAVFADDNGKARELLAAVGIVPKEA